MANNEKFHQMLVDGVTVEYFKQGETIGLQVKLVDFSQPENDTFFDIHVADVQLSLGQVSMHNLNNLSVKGFSVASGSKEFIPLKVTGQIQMNGFYYSQQRLNAQLLQLEFLEH